MSIEVMKQALEALLVIDLNARVGDVYAAIHALRQAIAEAEQAQPVAQYSDIISDGGLDPRNQFDAPPQRQLLIDKMREMLEVQGQHGTWDYDPYMQGMYNGMEYMLAMVEDREPVFREAPEKWLRDRKRQMLTDERLQQLMYDYGYDFDDEVMLEMLKEVAHGIKGEA